MSYDVSRVMKLSTAHLSEETAIYLCETDCMDWPTVGGPYRDAGWFFHIDEDAWQEACSPILQDLFETFRFAAREGYDIIHFCDITMPIDELPVYRDYYRKGAFWKDDIVYRGSYDRRNAKGRPSAFMDVSVPPSADVATQALRYLQDQISEAHNDLLALPFERIDVVAVDPGSLGRWNDEMDKLNSRFRGFRALVKYMTRRLSTSRNRQVI
jgi:hypothetical protein